MKLSTSRYPAILCFAFSLFGISLFTTVYAQVPQAFNYQGVARDASGTAMPSTNIGLRFSILHGSPVGPADYVETHSLTTNVHGLFTVQVGSGSVVSGTFSGIQWGGGSKYMKVEMDAAGGTNYTVMGTSQLISVPYALYADSSATPGPAGPQGPQGPPGPAPTGSANQTIRYGTNGWEGTSSLWNDGTNLGVGTTSPAAKLDVNGTTRTTGLTIPTGASNGHILTSDATGNASWQAPAAGGGDLDDAYDFGGAGQGRIITADAGAVQINTSGSNPHGIDVNVNAANGIGVESNVTMTGSVGLKATSTNASNTFSSVQAETNSSSTAVAAVVGHSDGAANGVAGQVASTATAQQAVYGSNLRTNGGHGVRGIGLNGVVGETNYQSGFAVYGENFDQLSTGNGIGTAGKGFYGVVGEDKYLGTVSGAYGVYCNGALAATGTKSFQIDHPHDPSNKYLRHFAAESNEVLNMYRGNVQLDANGEATVTLPHYFEDINKNYSYHLTPIGGFAQLYIKEKISNGQFKVAGGNANMEVSWMVMAERNDELLQQNPHMRAVELQKGKRHQGKYLMPYLYGQPKEKAVLYRKESEEFKQDVLPMK